MAETNRPLAHRWEPVEVWEWLTRQAYTKDHDVLTLLMGWDGGEPVFRDAWCTYVQPLSEARPWQTACQLWCEPFPARAAFPQLVATLRDTLVTEGRQAGWDFHARGGQASPGLFDGEVLDG